MATQDPIVPKWNYGTADTPVTAQTPSNDPMLTGHVINQVNNLGFNGSQTAAIASNARQTGVAPTTYNAQTGTVIAPQANSASQAIAQGIKQTPISPLASSTPISPSTTSVNPSTPTVTLIAPTAGSGLTSGKTAISPIGTTPTTAVTPTNTTKNQTVGISDSDFTTILASIDPNNIYTNEQKKSLRDTLSQNVPDTLKGLATGTIGAKSALEEYKSQANAWRMQRDVVDQMDTNNIMNQRQVQDLTRNYTKAIDDQKQRIESDANNASVMMGSTGRLSSRNMINAIHQTLDNNTKVYNDLVSQQDVMTKRLAQDLDMATKTLSKAYNDAVSDDMQEALRGINALDSTGAMNTKAGLIQARSVIDGVLQNKVTNLNAYYQGLNSLNEQYKSLNDDSLKQKKVDDTVTKTMNDGYLYNANGTKIVNDSGVPLTYNPQKQIESAIKNDDGSTTILYKDGSFDTKKFGGTPGQEAISAWAQSVANGITKISDIPLSIRDNVMAEANKLPQAGQWEYTNIIQDGETRTVERNKITGETREINGSTITPNMQTATDYSGNHDLRGLASKFPGQAWAKNNNPAGITWNGNFDNPKTGTTAYNLMQAGVNFEKGTPRPGNEGGNYVSFPTIEDGIKAQRIMMQVTYGNNTVGQMLQKWVGTSEGPRYAAQVAGNAGVDLNRKVSDLSEQELSQLQNAKIAKESPGLAKLLASPEFNPPTTEINPAAGSIKDAFTKAGIDPTSPISKDYTATDIALFNKFLSGKDTKDDEKQLKKLGYNRDNINDYAKKNPVKGLSDDQRAIYTSQVNGFHGNQVVKDYESQIGQVSNAVASLSDKSGPGDIAAIYQFMKTLDPTSTVREGEFQVAASSAGVLQSIGNTFSKLENGERLSDEQKRAFGGLMKQYLKNKGNQYDRLYDDMERVTSLSGIPSEYLPKRASGDLSSILGDKKDSTITTSSGFKFNPGATTPSSSILHPEEASQLDSIF